MPTSKRRSGKTGGRSGKTGKNGALTVKREQVKQGMSAGPGQDNIILGDLSLRPPSGVFRSSPPRTLANQVVWCRQSFTRYISTSTTAIVEQNDSFTAAGNMQDFASWLALFDQYYLHSVVLSITNTVAPGGTATLPQVFTAIDFDSSAVLGSIAKIQAYGSCNISTLGSGDAVTRYVEPCNATYIGASSAAGVTRTWVDSQFNNVPFYATRSILNTTTAVVQCDYTYTLLWAFRNSVG